MSVPRLLQDILHLYNTPAPSLAPSPLPPADGIAYFQNPAGTSSSSLANGAAKNDACNDAMEGRRPSGSILKVHFTQSHAMEVRTGPASSDGSEEGEEEERTRQKSVSFPADEQLVSGTVDAPRPRFHQPAHFEEPLNLHELLSAYVTACRVHRLSPSTKIEKQISMFHTRPGERQEILSLRGEKVKEAGMNVLESILCRVQFRALDFEYSFLDDEAAVALADMLEYYDSTLRLNLSFNQHIGPRGWQALSKVIRKSPCLEQLNLRYTSLGERSVPLLARALRADPPLRILHLENCALTGKSMLLLACALKNNKVMEELYLAENGLAPSDAAHLYQIISANTALQLIDLRNNNLGDTGISHICDGLRSTACKDGSRLTTLVLWNNRISPNGVRHIARALMENAILQTLNMGCNPIGAEGVAHAKDAIARNRTLLRLGLQATKLNCQGAISIAEAIAENPSLLRVDLRENAEIKSAGLLALHLALKMNTSITTLNLDRTAALASGTKDYGEQFRRLYDEMEEFCERNRALYEVKLLQEFEAQQRSEEEARLAREEWEDEEDGEAEVSGPKSPGPGLVRDPSLTCADHLSLADLAQRQAACLSAENGLLPPPALQPPTDQQPLSTEQPAFPTQQPPTPTTQPSPPKVHTPPRLHIEILPSPTHSAPTTPSAPTAPTTAPRSPGRRFVVSPVPRPQASAFPSTSAPVPATLAPPPLVHPIPAPLTRVPKAGPPGDPSETGVQRLGIVREVVEDLLTFCVYEVGDHPHTPSVARSRASLVADFAAATVPVVVEPEVRSVVEALVRRVERGEGEEEEEGEEGREEAVAGVVRELVRDAVRLERESHRQSLRARRQKLQQKLGH